MGVVLVDFEMGGHSSSFNWAHQRTADGSDPIDALLLDPRWPALRGRLNAAGAPYGVDFSDPMVRDMRNWDIQGWRMHIWGSVVVQHYVAETVNASVHEPVLRHFPNVRLSNFAHGHHTDPTGVVNPS
eukprot:gene12657-1478_t